MKTRNLDENGVNYDTKPTTTGKGKPTGDECVLSEEKLRGPSYSCSPLKSRLDSSQPGWATALEMATRHDQSRRSVIVFGTWCLVIYKQLSLNPP